MFVNEQKIEEEIALNLAKRAELRAEIAVLEEKETHLTHFLNVAREYSQHSVLPVVTPARRTLKPGQFRQVADNTLGGKARARRIELGLSQRNVAHQVKCSIQTVSSFELNRTGLGKQMQMRLLQVLGLPTDKMASRSRGDVKRQTIIVQAIAAAFEAGDIVTGREAFEKIGDKVPPVFWQRPANARRFSPTHLIANLLMLENRPGGILERISSGHYRVLENAPEIVQKRLEAETAEVVEA